MTTETRLHTSEPEERIQAINAILNQRSDSDWNYSRITLCPLDLESFCSPYVLQLEEVDLATPEGRLEFKELSREVAWGERHTSELGILEFISLRINQTILAAIGSQKPSGKCYVVRISRRDALIQQGLTSAAWYEVTEVVGDQFETR